MYKHCSDCQFVYNCPQTDKNISAENCDKFISHTQSLIQTGIEQERKRIIAIVRDGREDYMLTWRAKEILKKIEEGK
jgi:hypothetical protein